MSNDRKKKKSPFRYLRAILYVLAVDVVLFLLAVLADVKAAENASATGHPAPGFVTAAFLILSFVTVPVILISVIRTIAGLAKGETPESSEGSSGDNGCAGEKKAKKPMTRWKALRPLLLLPGKCILDSLLLYAAAKGLDPLPEGVYGFPLSAELFLTVALAAVTSLAVLILVIILLVIRLKRLKKERAS